ncbi:hypothetical protein L218DRAFT_935572 [Marasmius fiardii PR-910]|nr:hypothetical protein L218DRAFT_935572 [Marasmius fiardii PR-910]
MSRTESPFDLPVEVHEQIFHDLSADDLLNYELVDKTAREAVKSFYRNAFQIERVLLPYFGPLEITIFRLLQYTTGLVISGSTALSFFTREVYDGSDLDLYVECTRSSLIFSFLISVGYKYEPRRTGSRHQPDTLEEAVHDMHLRTEDDLSFISTMHESMTYDFPGIGDVVNFVKGGKKVQVIACTCPPLIAILQFHSTVVMNVIDYSHAISFYPQATFRDKLSLQTTERDAAVYEKYEKRGWRMISEPLTIPSFFDENSAINGQENFRYPGDRHCWTIPLCPVDVHDALRTRIQSLQNQSPPSKITSFSWRLFHKKGYISGNLRTYIMATMPHNKTEIDQVEREVEADSRPDEPTQNQQTNILLESPEPNTNEKTYNPVLSEVASIILRGYKKANSHFPITKGYRFPSVRCFIRLEALLTDLSHIIGFVPEVFLFATTNGHLSVRFNARVKIPDMLEDVVEGFMDRNSWEFDKLRSCTRRISIEFVY